VAAIHLASVRGEPCGAVRMRKVKIVINDDIIEQVADFKYLGYRISEYKSDLEDKFANIQQNKRSYTETFWKTNEQRNKIKNSQHYS